MDSLDGTQYQVDMSGVSPDMGRGVGVSMKGQKRVEFMVVGRCTG